LPERAEIERERFVDNPKGELSVPESSSEAFEEFIMTCRKSLSEQVRGRTESFQSLWSQADDVVLMGAAGSHAVGWNEVSASLTWASEHLDFVNWHYENLTTSIGDELAFTCDLEHMSHEVDGQTQDRTLRASQGYRFENEEWRVVFRHGDPMSERIEPPEVGPR
jgi:ketosteroid isomerase-like protein